MSAASERTGWLSCPEPTAVADGFCLDPSRLYIGLRHHSPSLAAAIPKLLERFAPTRILLELPPNFQDWIKWLGDSDLQAPIALAGASDEGRSLSFFPFADFSPELAALRWAVSRDCEVEAIDLPLGARANDDSPHCAGDGTAASPLLAQVCARANAGDAESLWDQLVESRARSGSEPALHRAALVYGWMTRAHAYYGTGVEARDLARETHMRERIAHACTGDDVRIAIIVGSFHAAALLPTPFAWEPRAYTPHPAAPPVTSLVPYSHELLDSRSGYPAGIRDPAWQHKVWTRLSSGQDCRGLASAVAVELCRQLRGAKLPAGVPDASELVRMATDLACLRGLPGPGRREVLEAVQTCLSHGEVHGRGRALARALEPVMVGYRRGQLPPGAPSSGLLPAVIADLGRLRLPGPETADAQARTIRLNPLRSDLDLRRLILLERLRVCGVSYGKESVGEAAGGLETLARTWELSWGPATQATLELAGMRGVTLAQATRGALHSQRHRLQDEDQLGADARLQLATLAARTALPKLVAASAEELGRVFLHEASLPNLLAALAWFDRLYAGLSPGLRVGGTGKTSLPAVQAVELSTDDARARLLSAGVRALSGTAGSNDPRDAKGALELAQRVESDDAAQERLRLSWELKQMADSGSALMGGAAQMILALLDARRMEGLASLLGSWIDGCATQDPGIDTYRRLGGALVVGAPLFESDPRLHRELLERVAAMSHEDFVRALPRLREAVDLLAPMARERLLEAIYDALDIDVQDLDLRLEADPADLARWAAADAFAAIDPTSPPSTSRGQGGD